MSLVRLYQCLCDRTRLRLLHLLRGGPLCVCHLQAALRLPQVKVSRHLRYLRARGLVESRRAGTWRIYRLPARRPAALEANLRCLQDCCGEEPQFRRDRERLARLRAAIACCAPFRAAPAPAPAVAAAAAR